MATGRDREAPEREGPDEDEEEEDEQRDGVRRRVLRGPEVPPVAAVGRGEEEVLDQDGDEEPGYYLAAQEGAVEGGDAAGGLAVVVWQAEEEDDADSPHEQRDGHRDSCQGRPVGYERGSLYAGQGQCVEARTPEPQQDDVDLLRALDGAGAETPGRDGDAAFAAEVEGEEEGAAGGGGGVEACCDILDPASTEFGGGVGRETEEEEGESVADEGRGEDIFGLKVAKDEPPDY